MLKFLTLYNNGGKKIIILIRKNEIVSNNYDAMVNFLLIDKEKRRFLTDNQHGN